MRPALVFGFAVSSGAASLVVDLVASVSAVAAAVSVAAGSRSTMLTVPAREAASVVAVNPPAVPVETAAPLSATNDPICPPPVPTNSSRTTAPLGALQSVVNDDLSAQYDSSQEPPFVTETVGVVCVTVFAGSERVANVATGSVVAVPSYATS